MSDGDHDKKIYNNLMHPDDPEIVEAKIINTLIRQKLSGLTNRLLKAGSLQKKEVDLSNLLSTLYFRHDKIETYLKNLQ